MQKNDLLADPVPWSAMNMPLWCPFRSGFKLHFFRQEIFRLFFLLHALFVRLLVSRTSRG